MAKAALAGMVALVLATTMQDARADDSLHLAALGEQIESAYHAEDLARIEMARQALLRVAMQPGDGERAAYYAAYARFRQALVASGEPQAARSYLEDCIRELEVHVARRPDNAEARAMLGSCYGISTLYNRLSMARRGLEARRQLAAARALAPDDPWVILQDGLADYKTPRLFGGDRQLGIRKLEQASALFTTAAASGSREASWAALETWQQLGRMYEETGRVEDARAAFARAEALALPDRQVLAAL